MKILAIIPARGGSKGVPRKNIRALGGKPLIAHTIESAIQSAIDDVIVSTDDNEIAEIAVKYGAVVPFFRDAHLASDSAKSIDVAIDALVKMENINNCIYEVILFLQPTTPFRNASDIINSLALFAGHTDVDSVISVVDVESFHPARMKYIENGLLVDPPFCEVQENQNRQELTQLYIRNGAIYLTRRETLLKGSFKGEKSLAYIMPLVRSSNIDTIDDFEYAEWILNKYFK
jgi:CMP-N,N'-diacetyllegionaminic acid synthase